MKPLVPFNWFGAKGALTTSLLGRYARWFHSTVNERWPEAKESALEAFKAPAPGSACMAKPFAAFVGYALPPVKPYRKQVYYTDFGTPFEIMYVLEPKKTEFAEEYKAPQKPGLRFVKDLRALDAYLMARITEKDNAKTDYSYGVAV